MHVAFAVPLALGPAAGVPVPSAAERQRLAAEMARFAEAAQARPVPIATVI
jgi:hypothetical protein